MPINSLFEQTPEILRKVCTIKDYMVENQMTDLRLFANNCNYVSIRLNKYSSPDGAMGMFLLLRRDNLALNPSNDLENLLTFSGICSEIEKIVRNNRNEFINMYGNRTRLQEKFEFFTYKKLQEKGFGPIQPEDINDYDFLTNQELAIEVKSDRWINTGNVSLELLRDYRIDNCQEYIENIGSVLKSKADYWQEYFYQKTDDGCSRFESEVYKLEDLQVRVNEIIDCLYENIFGNG